MQLPFTAGQFHGVFRDYNIAVWPMQAVLLAIAVAALVLLAWPGRRSGRVVSAVLVLLWTWLGAAYHLPFFAAINPLAFGFAGLSFVGAALFAWHGIVHARLRFRLRRDARTGVGVALIVFALAVYPAWSIAAGHPYPELPTFGLPCPVTLFTMGMLCFAERPFPRSVLAVPVLWSLIGAQAAFLLGVPQDTGLLVAALVGAVLFVRAQRPDDGTSPRRPPVLERSE